MSKRRTPNKRTPCFAWYDANGTGHAMYQDANGHPVAEGMRWLAEWRAGTNKTGPRKPLGWGRC